MATITGITQGTMAAPMQIKPYVGGIFPLVWAPEADRLKLPYPRKKGMLDRQQHKDRMAAIITAMIVGAELFFAGAAGVGSIFASPSGLGIALPSGISLGLNSNLVYPKLYMIA
jgi:hypothetical protein